MKSKALTKTQTGLILIGLMLSLLLSALDSTIVSTSMKMIVSDLQGTQYYAWPFTIYMLCSTVIIPIAGGISDNYGRKPIFVSGILLFLAGSALCGISQNMLQLIAFRGIQGIGGGILITSVFTLVTDIYPPQSRGKYMGIVTSMFGLASIVGPLLGGFITDNLSWHWIFYINIPIGVIALCIILIIMPNYKSEQQHQQIDYAGTIFLILTLVPMLLAFRLAGTDYPWISFPIIGMFTFSLIMLMLFILIEAKSNNPILPLSLFKKRSITITLLIAFLTNGIMFAAIIYIPYFVQAILGSNATMSGAITTPMMLGLMLTSNLAGIISSRNFSKRLLVIVAFILAAIGSGLLSTIGTGSPYYLVIIFMVILGLGIGISMPICNINVQNSVPFHQISTATSTVQFFRNIGGTVSSAIFGTIMINRMNQGFSKLDFGKIPKNVQELLKNPQIITDSEAVSRIMNNVPAAYTEAFTDILNQAKSVLTDSIRAIFLFSMIVALIGIVLALFFKDAPYRTSKQPPQEQAVSEVSQLES